MQKLWWVLCVTGNATLDSWPSRETDTHKLNEQTKLLAKMESDYQGMKLLLRSYEGSLKAVRTEAKYVVDLRNSGPFLTALKGTQRSRGSPGNGTVFGALS